MPNAIRMYRSSDNELLDQIEVPGGLPVVEGKLVMNALPSRFDMSALNEVDVYFELVTAPTGVYTTPAFSTPAVGAVHIAATEGGTVITGANQGATLYVVVTGVTGTPTPTLAIQWKVNGDNAGGTDDQASFSTASLAHEDVVTVAVTPTNSSGSGTPVESAEVEISIPVTPVTWNPGDKHGNITLTDGNRVAYNSGAANSWSVRATKFVSTGKAYFELSVEGITLHNSGSWVAVATSTPSMSGARSQSEASEGGGVSIRRGSSQVVYEDEVDVGASNVGDYGSSTLCVALDMTAGKVWFRVNGGSWTGDPAAGTGGYAVSAPVAAAVAPRAASGTPGGVRLRSLASEFTQAVPSGFVAYAAA